MFSVVVTYDQLVLLKERSFLVLGSNNLAFIAGLAEGLGDVKVKLLIKAHFGVIRRGELRVKQALYDVGDALRFLDGREIFAPR